MHGRPGTLSDRAGMRVLFYNWVDYLDDEGRGGGVSQYQRNLMRQMPEAVFLSSGISHDLRGGAPRWAPIRHGPRADRHRRFEIVNARPQSPSHHSFGDPAQVDHPPTVAAVADFLRAHGPFDVIHFNNLEGLPATVLTLKATFPDTAFVVALHNYYPFCPQVNLWHREMAHCTDFHDGASCIDCLPFRPDRRAVRMANALTYHVKTVGLRPGSAAFEKGVRPAIRRGGKAFRWVAARRRALSAARPRLAKQAPPAALAEGFRYRRAEMVRLINAHADAVLCVSERGAEIARGFGLRPDLVRVCHIGSDHAPRFAETTPRAALPRPDGTAQMAYLGYMRRDKGFFFLLDALESLPEALSRRLHLLIAAGAREGEALARLHALRPRFASLTWENGYRRDDLDRLLSETDFGVIPVLWEDTLPQVAIEMHSRHIPLLTANMGGARELGRYPPMVFRAGDAGDFAARIGAILRGEIDLAAYWAGAMAPVTLEAHAAALARLYSGLAQ